MTSTTENRLTAEKAAEQIRGLIERVAGTDDTAQLAEAFAEVLEILVDATLTGATDLDVFAGLYRVYTALEEFDRGRWHPRQLTQPERGVEA